MKDKVRLFIFFQGQNIYFQKVPAPPPQNKMVVPLYLKWKAVLIKLSDVGSKSMQMQFLQVPLQ